MTKSLRIRQAFASECGHLSELALRSKAHWGYSREFLESCRAELTLETSQLRDEAYQCFVAVDDNSILGFYALQAVSKKTHELAALFVEPGHIGRGIGRSLLQHAIRRLALVGAERLIIQGDPNAIRFYQAAGARQVGERESLSIPGRFLPLFEIDLTSS